MVLRKATAALIGAALVLAAGLLHAGGDAAQELKAIMDEIQRAGRGGSPYQLVDTAEQLLYDFMEKYPRTREAAQAHFALGQLYSNIQRSDDAVKHLNEYLNADVERPPREESIAHYVLASAYIAQEKFDKAEGLLKKILARSRSLDNRIVGMASKDLARLGTLRKLTIGAPAIDFTARSLDGGTVKLGEYAGKVVLLDFWASWCAPCRNEMPNVKGVYKEFHGKGFEIIGVSLDNAESNCRSYVNGEKLPWVQIFEGKAWMSEIGQKYAVAAIPATFLLDRKGTIRYKNLRGNALKEAVQTLIAEK